MVNVKKKRERKKKKNCDVTFSVDVFPICLTRSFLVGRTVGRLADCLVGGFHV